MLPFHPDGIVLPKVEAVEQIQWVSEKIEAAELDYGWPVHSIRLLVVMETPKAILDMKEIASHPRLDALIFGGEDYAASVGATRTPEALELFYARSAVVAASAAYGLQAVDMVSTNFKDLEGLHKEALFGAQLGYAGKQVIHPNQVAVVQAAFTPDGAAIVCPAACGGFQVHQAKGSGAFALDGRMIDMPIIKAAERLLERARAAGEVN